MGHEDLIISTNHLKKKTFFFVVKKVRVYINTIFIIYIFSKVSINMLISYVRTNKDLLKYTVFFFFGTLLCSSISTVFTQREDINKTQNKSIKFPIK